MDKTIHCIGFVSVGRGQGTIMGWDVIIERSTEQAVLLRDTETGRTQWLPRAALSPDNELTPWAVRKIRDAGFRAVDAYGDIT